MHLFHKNVTAEGSNFDNRPFQTLEEMHETIKTNWNNTVTNADHVYILGDLAWKENEDAISFILSEDYYKWEKEQRDKDTEFLIKEMYKKGFLLTKEMINQYEEWDSRSYDNYYDCIVEELELDED